MVSFRCTYRLRFLSFINMFLLMECAVPCYIFSQQSDLFFPMWNLYLPVTNLNHLLHWTFNPTANLCSLSWCSKLLCLDCLCCRMTFDTAKRLYCCWSSLLSSGNVKGTEQLLTALFWTVQEGIVWLKDNTGVFLCSVCDSNQCYSSFTLFYFVCARFCNLCIHLLGNIPANQFRQLLLHYQLQHEMYDK